MKKILLTFVITMAALFTTCSVAFASNAIVDSGGYTHPSQFSNCMVIDGIDVSYYQQNIDWGKVKRQGIDYAFIRIGYTNLDSPFRTNIDSFFEQNYENARANGVMVGVYYYSCATTIKEAQQEAQFVLDTLGGRKLDMPVAYDCEYAGRLKTAYDNAGTAAQKRTKLTTNSLAFLNYIDKNSDYEPVFYSYRSMTSPYGNPSAAKLNMNLIDNKYKVWLAQYSSDNSYERPYEHWQYTSSGKVTGITGSVDCNFWYYNNTAETVKSGTADIRNASVSLSRTSYEYTKFKKQPVITATYNGQTLKKGTDYDYYYIKNVLAGTGYAMIRGKGQYSCTKLVPFTINPCSMSDINVSDITSKFIYSGVARKPTITVNHGSTTLVKGTDYTVSYSNNTNAGTGKVTITGKRNYTGSVTKTFTISKATPTFTGTTSYSKKADSSDWTLNIKSSNNADLTYKSSDTSIATVNSSGKVTLKGKAGTVMITVTSAATANYNSASKQIKVTVAEADLPAASIITEHDSYSKTTNDSSFNLNASANSGGKLTYSSSNTSVASVSSAGYVTLKGTAGTAVITIKCAATDNYASASKTITITVTESENDKNRRIIAGVQATTLKIYSSLENNGIRLSWAKSPGFKVDHYQIFRATSKDGFGNIPFYTTKYSTTTTYKNTAKLVKGSRYYYKIRGVRTIDGRVVYTQWSKVIYRTFKPSLLAASDNEIIQAVEECNMKIYSSAGAGFIKLSWMPSDTRINLDGVEVYRSTSQNSGFKKISTFSKQSSKTYTAYLTKGVKYYYYIKGYKTVGEQKAYTRNSITIGRTFR